MNLALQMEGKDGSYLVGWVGAGFSFARVEIRELKLRNPWWPFGKPKLLWSTGSQPNSRYPAILAWAEKAHPAEVKAWYAHAVAEYEAYQRAWAKAKP